MVMYLAKILIGKLLSSESVKEKVFNELKKKAADSETTIDDEAVEVFGEIWDVVIPVLLGKL